LVSSFPGKELVQMLIYFSMKNSTEEIQQLRAKAEASMKMTAQLQQAYAQIEAAISRKENQKVSEKCQKV